MTAISTSERCLSVLNSVNQNSHTKDATRSPLTEDYSSWIFTGTPAPVEKDWVYAPPSRTTEEMRKHLLNPENLEYSAAISKLIDGFFEDNRFIGGFRDFTTNQWDTNKLVNQLKRDIEKGELSVTVNDHRYKNVKAMLIEVFKVPCPDEDLVKALDHLQQNRDQIFSFLCTLQQGVCAICSEAMIEIIHDSYTLVHRPFQFAEIKATYSQNRQEIDINIDWQIVDLQNPEQQQIPIKVLAHLDMKTTRTIVTWYRIDDVPSTIMPRL